MPSQRHPTGTEPSVLIVCSGGLEEHSGGVGRLMLYVVDAWRRNGGGPAFRVIDARGRGSIVWSPLHLLKALIQITIATITGKASVLHVNISVRGSAIRKSFILLLATILRRPVILHLHDGHFESFFKGLPKPGRTLLAKLFGKAQKVIVLGHHWRDVVARDLNVPLDDIVMLYNAVPDPRAAVAQPTRGETGRCNILFLGRLGPWKGVPVLLDALSSERLRNLDWHATLAGDGPVDDYREKVHEAGMSDRVHFPGWVSSSAAQSLLRQADILVLPSQGEGLPMSVLEALAHSVAVIATPVGSIPELITDDGSGLLIPVGDSAALASALHRLVANKQERHRIAATGRTVFERQLDVDVYATKLAELYRGAARTRTEKPPERQPRQSQTS